MARLIRADGMEAVIHPGNGKKFSLQELQQLVGGLVEAVPTTTRLRMYVNEEGRLKGLPLNVKATALLPPHYLQAGNFIVGDAVVVDKGEG